MMPWTLVVVTLMSCSDPLLKDYYGYYISQADCEAAAVRYRFDLTPGQHFECRDTVQPVVKE